MTTIIKLLDTYVRPEYDQFWAIALLALSVFVPDDLPWFLVTIAAWVFIFLAQSHE